MFKNLKIATAITSIIAFFTAMLVVALAFSVLKAVSNKANFEEAQVSTVNNNAMQDAMFNLNGSLAQIHSMLLQKALERPVSQQAVEQVRERLVLARRGMDTYIGTPFNSDEEQAAANALDKQFDLVMAIAQNNLNSLDNPLSVIEGLRHEIDNRNLMRERLAQYSEINDRYNRQLIETAEGDYRQMVGMAIVMLLISALLLLLARIWVKRVLVTRMAETTVSIQRIAQGDLTQRIDAGNENELGLMLKELEAMRLSLISTVSGIREGVGRIYANAQEIANGNNNLSSRTEEQASALQQTAASMEEIKTTVRQNADNAHNARQLADSASKNARSGGEVMTRLEEIMQQISKSSRQIADINGVIDSIANQTNILSLNAAVEAARAGEQGRGFAVVAEEVRNLARRSADAAKEINELIVNTVAIMETGTLQVSNASSVMRDIVSSVSQVTDIMGEITLASDEQSAGINQIAQAVNEMDLVTQQNATLVEEAAAAASNLESQSETLENIVSQFALDNQPAAFSASKPLPALRPVKHQEAEWETF
ncbi:methyl-accepting chemotaxis protein [Pantoea sp. ICBG 828]|uniref:methyl-accepting chemotaxis protein n=1 Tax=unclassified Pantoea TaxID=2630326 RepID=UPI000CE5330B|nr:MULTISPECIES: methyl-accepting chemotaxis protein [unclassified Pantoea]NIG35699.1 HAMP domain-containing protein [Pantoea sp. Ap-959]PPC66299.1 methyl-accepting chemotaxis protein [Pantoea sp. ICBG 828]